MSHHLLRAAAAKWGLTPRRSPHPITRRRSREKTGQAIHIGVQLSVAGSLLLSANRCQRRLHTLSRCNEGGWRTNIIYTSETTVPEAPPTDCLHPPLEMRTVMQTRLAARSVPITRVPDLNCHHGARPGVCSRLSSWKYWCTRS